MNCPQCGESCKKNGKARSGKQQYHCTNPNCPNKYFTLGDEPGEFVVSQSEDSLEIKSLSRTITTKEDALAQAEVDLTRWKVARFTTHHRDDGRLTNIWIRLEPRPFDDPDELARIVGEAVIETGKQPSPVSIVRSEPTGRMVEISAPDLHNGKLAWKPETGENYDLKISERVFKEAVIDLAGEAFGGGVDKWLLPFGNDMIHIDNEANTTAAGTRQDVDGRLKKVYANSFNLCVWAIDYLRDFAPVLVEIITGNHDRTLMWFIGHALGAYYRNTDGVEIDNSPAARKYVRYGASLIGFAHGDEKGGAKHADYPGIMSEERSQDWAEAKFRTWHLGDKHRKRETRHRYSDQFRGCEVTEIPSLSGTDAWHAEKGYVATPKEALAFVYDFEQGERARIRHRANPKHYA